MIDWGKGDNLDNITKFSKSENFSDGFLDLESSMRICTNQIFYKLMKVLVYEFYVRDTGGLIVEKIVLINVSTTPKRERKLNNSIRCFIHTLVHGVFTTLLDSSTCALTLSQTK